MKPILKIIGADGNVFNLIAIAKRCATENGIDWNPIQEEMTSGDYNNALRTLMKHFEISSVDSPDSPKPSDGSVMFPAGKYYLGDPCYVISESNWSKMCNATDCFEKSNCGTENLFELNGVQFFGASTAHGDGIFYDQDRNEYGVDAGMLSIVPLSLVLAQGKETEESIQERKLGRIFDFPKEFEVFVTEDHTFCFGDITIPTEDEEDSDDYYEDYSDEEDSDDYYEDL